MNIDLFDSLKNLMPGDVRTETIVVKNTSTDYDYVKVFLRAEPVSTTTAATASGDITMVEFLSQLTLSVYNNDKLISTTSAAEPGALSENLYLGTFYPGDAATLALTATVPASLGNKYSHASGDITWIFTTEAYRDGSIEQSPSAISLTVSNSTVQAFSISNLIPDSTESDSTSSSTSSSNPTSNSAVATSQSALVINLNTTPTGPWFIAFIISTLAFIITTIALIHNRKKSKPRF